MNTFTKFAICWLLMWGMSYIATALFAPEISGDLVLGAISYSFLGSVLIALVVARSFRNNLLTFSGWWIRYGLFALALVATYGGILSWSGVAVWNVPFPNKELFQVSMAFGNLFSAVLMLYLALFDE